MARTDALWWTHLACLAALLLPTSAAAEATVTVQVRSAAGTHPSGSVVLAPRSGGRRFSCTLQAGRCRMRGVPGGRYTAQVRTTKGNSPPKPVMIPPEGEVSLILSAP